MVYKIRDISRYVINFAFETNRSVTNLKLQKILYFLYGFYYFVTKDELFDEEFEAWAYGPVVRKSYVDYSMFGAEAIPPHNNYINFLFDEDHDYDSEKNNDYFDSIFSEDSKKTIDIILNTLLNKSTMDLVELSHAKGSPWYKVYREGEKNKINKSLIFDYFGHNKEEK